MILIVAPQMRWAQMIAEERGLTHRQWQYVGNVSVLRGWNAQDVTILLHEKWFEVPHIVYPEFCKCGKRMRFTEFDFGYVHLDDNSPIHRGTSLDPHYTYPITESIKLLVALGAKIEDVTT